MGRSILGYAVIGLPFAAALGLVLWTFGHWPVELAVAASCIALALIIAGHITGKAILGRPDERHFTEEIEWREIGSAPQDGTRILASWDAYRCGPMEVRSDPDPIIVRRIKDHRRGAGFYADNGDTPLYVTHWKPLPAPVPPSGPVMSVSDEESEFLRMPQGGSVL